MTTTPAGPRVFPLVLVAIGLPLLGGGLKLMFLGGSLVYASTGSVLLSTGILLWRGSRWGTWLYVALLIGTTCWAIAEVGLDRWGLLPRLDLFVVLGLWLMTPSVQRRLSSSSQRSKHPLLSGTLALAVVLALVLAGLTILVVLPPGARHPEASADAFTSDVPASAASDPVTTDWQRFGNDEMATHYSDLTQINPNNVQGLKLAWSFRTGEYVRPGEDINFEATPLKIGPLLYFCTPSNQVYALNAATGQLVWHFDPKIARKAAVCRGVSYSATSTGSEPCAERIYVATLDDKLWSLDALTGSPCATFGTAGSIDLLAGLGDVVKGSYTFTSPPLVVQDKLILGASVQDNLSIDMPSGVVRAFDAASGRLSWAWDLGRPDRPEAPTPPETYTRSTPNAWAPMVADASLGLIYVPLGNPAADFWGLKRREFDEQYGSSLVALDVNTGRERWRFQATHHDLWDNDLSSQPSLVDVPTAGDVQPAVVIGTKQGNLFVLNRLTGVPIVPVTELPAPGPSNIGEKLSPTQPASALAVNPGPAFLTEAAMWGMTPVDQLLCRLKFRTLRYQGAYTPPGTGPGSIAYPGMFGGIEWGGVAIDPIRKIMIANPSAMAFVVRMASIDGAPNSASAGLQEVKGTGHAAWYYAFLSPLGIPCVQPPWGKLYAIDLKTNRIIWERPVGTARDTGPFGLAVGLPLLIGTPQVGGTLVTRSGLIFSGATLDRYLRAYQLTTGRELWRTRLPAGGQASPMTYDVAGQQFVAIAAGGHGGLKTKPGDYLMAYSLN